MVLQKQYNLRQWNNAMTDCISLIQLVRFLNQTIYKLKHAMEAPRTRAPSLLLLLLPQPCIEQMPCAFLWHFSFCGCHRITCHRMKTCHLQHVKTSLGNTSGEA